MLLLATPRIACPASIPMLVFEDVIVGLVLWHIDGQVGVIAHVVQYICVDKVLMPRIL